MAAKILFITVPLRADPARYPPIGVLSLLSALRKHGHHNYSFFDIDCLRPSYQDAIARIKEEMPEILAVSGVVSTGYGFVKKLTLEIKKELPSTTIILGGNLGASAEILLRKTGVDFVANGEGEKIICDFLDTYESGNQKKSYTTVKGLLFLDDNKLINTGYADEMDNKEIYDVDFNDLAKYSDIDHYIYPFRITPGSHFEHDPRSYERHRIGKKTAFLTMSKGCVAKCTFCHRWDKGIRYIPVPIIIDRIKTLIEDYNVGFLAVGDENFGTDKKWLAELCSEIKKLDILWNVHGMRVNSVSNEKLQMMKDAGCVETVFGMETGSARMLKIMNKGVQLHHNYSALDYIAENELTTTVQLVLNMPGECEETIEETGEFIRYAVELNPESSPLDHSMNYAQALPGTPLYEFARHKGLIGQDLDAEEKYLLWISDKNAADENFTTFFNDLPRLQVLGWRFYLSAVALHAYRKKFGKARYIEHIKAKFTAGIDTDDTGYFNFPKEKWGKELNLNLKDNIRLLSLVIRNPGKIMFLMPGIFVRSKIFLRCFVLAVYTRKRGIKYSSGLLVENIKFLGSKILGSSRKGVFNYDYKSLRKIMKEDTNHYDTVDSTMLPLRLGRW